jgi:hypothetical protein
MVPSAAGECARKAQGRENGLFVRTNVADSHRPSCAGQVVQARSKRAAITTKTKARKELPPKQRRCSNSGSPNMPRRDTTRNDINQRFIQIRAWWDGLRASTVDYYGVKIVLFGAVCLSDDANIVVVFLFSKKEKRLECGTWTGERGRF